MAQQRKIGLGKGLSALLDDSDEVIKRPTEQGEGSGSNKGQAAAGDQRRPAPGSIAEIEIDRIAINPFQPRSDFDQQALEELAESIKIQGLIQPITVREDKSGHFQLISG